MTPGLPVGRHPGHRRGHRPKRFMFMCLFLSCLNPPNLGRAPSTASTFRKKFRINSGKRKRSESVSGNSPQEYGWDRPSAKPYNSRHLRLPEHFQNSLPPVQLGVPLFQKWFQRGPLRAGHGIPSNTEGISDTWLRFYGNPGAGTGGPETPCVSNDGSLLNLDPAEAEVPDFNQRQWKKSGGIPEVGGVI